MQMLVIDADAALAFEMQARGRSRGWRVGHAATLEEGATRRAQGEVDLAVLSLDAGDRGDQAALDWLRALRLRDERSCVLALTGRRGVEARVAALRCGADDCLEKPFAPAEIDARVDALARRLRRADRAEVRYGGIAWLGTEGRAYAHGKALALMPREFEVLGVLMRHAPQLCPKQSLVQALARRSIQHGDGVVELYVSRLRRKLEAHGIVIRTRRGFGYELASGPPRS
jgi:DNA-binding response OmpR family regulator